MTNPQPSSMVSIMINFGEDEAGAKQLFNKVASSDEQRVTIPFGNQTADNQLGQVVDKYGITWLICSGKLMQED